MSSNREGVRPRILILAYGCAPNRGSEPGVGWMWSRALAGFADVWVLTQGFYEAEIERALPEVPEKESLTFVYPSESRWSQRLRFSGNKEWGRWHYLTWQRAAVRVGRALEADIGFDLVWHLTISAAWLGSLGPLIGPPFVFGPVGGGVSVPLRHLRSLGPRGMVFEAGRSAARATGRFLNPAARLAWRRATRILANNTNTRDWLPASSRSKATVFANSVIEEVRPIPPRAADGRAPTAIFAGRLIGWKGGVFAVDAMRHLPDWRLLIVGDGPDRRRLARRVEKLGLGDRVAFFGWMQRPDLHEMMRTEADIFLFPSLHDDAPLGVVEAVSCGLPVVCLDRGGPPVLAGRCGFVVASEQPRKRMVSELAVACRQAYDSSLTNEDFLNHVRSFTVDAKRRVLQAMVSEIQSGHR
jgi:glycosyltransferase involved in cell wall biosynthesis